jgi:glutaredoxin-related protein
MTTSLSPFIEHHRLKPKARLPSPPTPPLSSFKQPTIVAIQFCLKILKDKSMSQNPILYIKPGCPWCREATGFFSQHGVTVNVRDVLSSKANMQRMIEVSGQSLTPTFEYEDFIVADFSVDEFINALEQAPEIKKKLGLGDKEDWN